MDCEKNMLSAKDRKGLPIVKTSEYQCMVDREGVSQNAKQLGLRHEGISRFLCEVATERSRQFENNTEWSAWVHCLYNDMN